MLLADRHRELIAACRPRERLFADGVSTLRDSELIAVLIGTGIPRRSAYAIADDVLAVLDRTGGVPDRQTLADIPGLGPARIAALCAAFELARRVICPSRIKIRLPGDILPIVDRFIDRQQECFLTISLNGAHEVMRTRIVTIGLVNRTMVHPREVFADLVTDRAAAVILAHNHPSGCVEPSDEDRDVTERLVAAGRTLGIPVLDHVVFGHGGYHSFLEHDEL
jgi:DNA repair protein RadC